MTLALSLLAVLLAGTACEGVDSGTAVGNPGRLGFATDEPDDGTQFARVDAHVVEVRASWCDGTLTERVIVDDIFDLLQPMARQVVFPAGEYCTLDVELDATTPIAIEGTTAAGHAFDIVLAPGIVRFDGDFLIDDNDYIIEFGIARTLPSEELDALGPDSSTGKNDPLATTWAEAVELDSELETDVGEVVARSGGENDTASPGDLVGEAGCGCQAVTAQAPYGSVIAVLVALIALRRRNGTLNNP